MTLKQPVSNYAYSLASSQEPQKKKDEKKIEKKEEKGTEAQPREEGGSLARMVEERREG